MNRIKMYKSYIHFKLRLSYMKSGITNTGFTIIIVVVIQYSELLTVLVICWPNVCPNKKK